MLFLYSPFPIVRATCTGMREADPAACAAANLRPARAPRRERGLRGGARGRDQQGEQGPCDGHALALASAQRPAHDPRKRSTFGSLISSIA